MQCVWKNILCQVAFREPLLWQTCKNKPIQMWVWSGIQVETIIGKAFSEMLKTYHIVPGFWLTTTRMNIEHLQNWKQLAFLCNLLIPGPQVQMQYVWKNILCQIAFGKSLLWQTCKTQAIQVWLWSTIYMEEVPWSTFWSLSISTIVSNWKHSYDFNCYQNGKNTSFLIFVGFLKASFLWHLW